MNRLKEKSFKALILYFSGTGNTHFVAMKIKDTLNNSGIKTDITAYEVCNFDDISNYDVLIYGFPIYAYSMPEFMKVSIKDLKKPKTNAVFIFSTYALHPGNALRKSSILFKKNGFIPIGTGKIKLPGSDGMLFLKDNAPYIKKINSVIDNQNKNIEALSLKIKDRLIKLIKTPDPISFEKIPCLSYPSIFIEAFIIPPFLLIEKWIKKRFYADQNCTHCGICQKICPSGNITVIKDRVIFSNKCYLCLRCIHQCPEKAIQIGKITKGKHRYKGPDGKFNPVRYLKIN